MSGGCDGAGPDSLDSGHHHRTDQNQCQWSVTAVEQAYDALVAGKQRGYCASSDRIHRKQASRHVAQPAQCGIERHVHAVVVTW